jgi:hypothetical protein
MKSVKAVLSIFAITFRLLAACSPPARRPSEVLMALDDG